MKAMGPGSFIATLVPRRGRRCAMPKGYAPPPPDDMLLFDTLAKVIAM